MVRFTRKRKSPGRRRAMRSKPRRKAPGKRRMAKRSSDYAKVVEIQETPLVAINDNNNDSVGGQLSFCLADYQRPQEVAHAYKYYRASHVEISFIPYFNIAQTNGAAGTRLPQMYMSVDRVGNRWIAPIENEMLERGISPRVFNKKMRLSFKPNLLQGISLETNQPAEGGGLPLGVNVVGYQNAVPLFNKWLPTQQSFGYSQTPGAGSGVAQIGQVLAPTGVNPYALRYYGAIFCPAIESIAPNTPQTVGDIQVKITWEFKGPRSLASNRPIPEPNPYVTTSSQGGNNAIPNTQPTTYP